MGDTIKTRFWDFRDLLDGGLKAYLAIATSLQTRNPRLAPRKDKFFKRQLKSGGLWVSSQQPRVKIKQNRAGQCDKGIKDLSIAG